MYTISGQSICGPESMHSRTPLPVPDNDCPSISHEWRASCLVIHGSHQVCLFAFSVLWSCNYIIHLLLVTSLFDEELPLWCQLQLLICLLLSIDYLKTFNTARVSSIYLTVTHDTQMKWHKTFGDVYFNLFLHYASIQVRIGRVRAFCIQWNTL